ncbi:hypothetical protein [Jiella mangrovi]|uniref:DUF995 domain-containing protein n=1 Tax=Jiella mangrovi TaxID=2821407 RepID=A0ABS4BBL3_9HYPH|nr:hypothetical protein [Jiella mangrovi]MBP0614145.1 hypothetical protein [Jiella mangrovi]
MSTQGVSAQTSPSAIFHYARLVAVGLLAFLLFTSVLGAEEIAAAGPAGSLDDAGLISALSGRNLEGVYADATPWSEAYAKGGTLSYRDRLGLWAGDWSVRNDRFCTFYRDEAISGGCFLVARRGENCFDFYAVDLSSEPVVAAGDIAAGRNWTARGWYVEAESTCPDENQHVVEILSHRTGPFFIGAGIKSA